MQGSKGSCHFCMENTVSLVKTWEVKTIQSTYQLLSFIQIQKMTLYKGSDAAQKGENRKTKPDTAC